jgi:hypothetical protein
MKGMYLELDLQSKTNINFTFDPDIASPIAPFETARYMTQDMNLSDIAPDIVAPLRRGL